MTQVSDKSKATRIPLSRDRVLSAAVDLADESGIEALSMRRIGQSLGVEAMSLYNHVANKEDILDGILDVIVAEIDMDQKGSDWKTVIRARSLSARTVLVRHPWAPEVIQTRTTITLTMMKFFEAGFSVDLAHHAMHALGSRTLGFTQELFDEGESDKEAEEEFMRRMTPEDFPNALRMLAGISHDDDTIVGNGCDDEAEFVFGLDLVLDGLDRILQSK